MKKFMLALIMIFTSLNLQAHEGGHGVPLKEWKFDANIPSIQADLIKVEDGKAWLMDDSHTIKAIDADRK